MHKKKGNLIGLSLSLVILTACAQNEKKNNSAGQEEIKQNQLANAKSPYLLQHADNPVDWYEWGPEALEKAKKENKPLIISIGYASCHWCHVMEHESFMDSSVAKIMNENFVPVKIDREERPDIDQVYMNAVQLLTGSGGWPLNAFALPNGKPFYAGTYYPRDQWVQVLKEIATVYKNQHEKVVQQANLLTEGIKGQEIITMAGDSSVDFTKNTYTGIFDGWKSRIDYTRGGYKGAPKFPLPAGWEFLLQFHYLTEDDKALDAVNQTLDAMAKGGIYDQVGGGFARYSTDARWFAPHFEKMLYDNGQLVSLYSHAYKVTKNETYARVIRETLEFINREMTGPMGEFHSSLNADSEGEEGKFYVWRMEEIKEVLEPRTATLITDYYQLEKGGNWEGQKNILFRKKNMQEFAKEHKLSFQEWDNILSEAKSKMLKARSRRSRPSTDDKVLTGWNALMMRGYLDAYVALGEQDYLQAALKNARFLEETMLQPNGRLWRNYREGEAGINAFLDDYALLASSYIQLYQATFDVHWLNLAKKTTEYAVSHFLDEKSGMFFYTSDESETLIARKMEITDNVIPSSNSVMANVLYRLGEYYYHTPYIDMSVRMLNHVVGEIPGGGAYYANWGMLMGLITFKPYEIAIMGMDASTKNKAMQARYLPTSLFMGGREENLMLLENKLIPGETMIYVCRNKACKMPVNDVNQAFEQLKW